MRMRGMIVWGVCVFVLACAAMGAGTATGGGGAKAPPRLAVPGTGAQWAGAKAVEEAFGADIAKAAKNPEKAAVAQRMLAAVLEAKDDTGKQYVLLVRARDLAKEAGDVGTAIQAVDWLANAFVTDRVEMGVEALTGLSTVVKGTEPCRAFVAASNDIGDAALKAQQYETAKKLADLAVIVARKAGDSALVTAAGARVQLMHEIVDASPAVQAALKTLASTPTNSDAKLTLGKFYCFLLGDWDKGLPYLAGGSDLGLRDLAGKDKAIPKTADARLELADGWWALGEKETSGGKRQMVLRGAYWYEAAAPGLDATAKAKADKRVEEAWGGQPHPAVTLAAPATEPVATTVAAINTATTNAAATTTTATTQAGEVKLVWLETCGSKDGQCLTVDADGVHVIISRDRKASLMRMHLQGNQVYLEPANKPGMRLTEAQSGDQVSLVASSDDAAAMKTTLFRVVKSVSSEAQPSWVSLECGWRSGNYLILEDTKAYVRRVAGPTSRKQATFRIVEAKGG